MINDISSVVRLASDRRMPMLGFGTWRLKDGQETSGAVATAIQTGYRHIDTAAVYENEKGVGEGIRQSGLPREEIFLTTKVWNDSIRRGTDAVRAACEDSLKLLGLDYIDLYLLHWPIAEGEREAWQALEELYAKGLARSIGVCNYLPHHLDRFLPGLEVPPMVNQVEFHPYLVQPELMAYCREHAIVQEAWSPLMQGEVGQVPEIVQIAKSHQKTPAQVALRWNLQHGVVTIPKSAHPERIAENAGIFDFSLSENEMAALDALDRGKRLGPDPDNFSF